MLEDYANDLRMLIAQLHRSSIDAGWKGKSLRDSERKRSSFRKNSTKPLAPVLLKRTFLSLPHAVRHLSAMRTPVALPPSSNGTEQRNAEASSRCGHRLPAVWLCNWSTLFSSHRLRMERGCILRLKQDRAMKTVWAYVDTRKKVGDPDHC